MTPEKALVFVTLLLVCLAVKSGCVAMSIWLDRAAPVFTARALRAYQERGVRSFVLGIVNGIVLGILFVAMANGMNVFKPVAVLVLFTLVAGVMAGYMIAYHDFGQRLRSDRNWSASQTILLGGITAEAAFMTPVLGQIVSIGVLFRGLGAVISALLSRGSAIPAGSSTPS